MIENHKNKHKNKTKTKKNFTQNRNNLNKNSDNANVNSMNEINDNTIKIINIEINNDNNNNDKNDKNVVKTEYKMTGCDPYTFEAFEKRMGFKCLQYNFIDITNGSLLEYCEKNKINKFSLIVCSYALHLCDKDKLQMVVYFLSLCCQYLLILTPHKRPQINHTWGFQLLHENVINRVRIRYYQSTN